MRKTLSLILVAAIVLSLCCCGVAFADESKETSLDSEKSTAVEAAVFAEGTDELGDAAEPEDADEPENAEEPEESEVQEVTEAEEAAEAEDEAEAEDPFAEWNKDAPALNALIEYVEAVTDEKSEDFIPVEDRIAVFDMDGTLYGELFPTYLEYYMLAWRILKDESITPDAEMLALGRELRESVISHNFASDLPIRHAQQAARAYAGLTLQEFADFVNSILVREVDGFEGMTYATAFYLPMLEVIEYLQENNFEVYVVSGSDRFICRNLLEGMIDIPYAHIIGMDVVHEATGQGDADGLDYVYQAGDDVVRTDKLIIKNLQTNKVLQIVQDIGQKPVLSFGNSNGDVSMHNYTISKNPYRSAAFMLIADDEERDYGNEQKVQALKEKWEESGYYVISMKNDFRTIYGDGVVKTGSFRWAEELAEKRVADEASPDWIGALPEAETAEQLFVVAGLGDSLGGSIALVSMHEKDSSGAWKQIMVTPGFIGKNGLGKEAEGDGKTPVGTYSFNAAFGNAEDPGCAISYHKVTADDYWSCDQREGYHYNELVSIKDLPELDTKVSEHLIDKSVELEYALSISYNEEGTPGLGSAIFLHCFGLDTFFSEGCVSIAKEEMLTVMQNVSPDCVVVIDSLKNLSPETWDDWGLEPGDGVVIDYGNSELYTRADMDAAIALIRREFATWEGCELHSISYVGDESCTEENIEWLNSLGTGNEFTQYIEFSSSFHSPIEGGGAWNPDSEYTDWTWSLGRVEGGSWELISWGY